MFLYCWDPVCLILVTVHFTKESKYLKWITWANEAYLTGRLNGTDSNLKEQVAKSKINVELKI